MGVIILCFGLPAFFKILFCDTNNTWRVNFKLVQLKYQIVNRKVSGYLVLKVQNLFLCSDDNRSLNSKNHTNIVRLNGQHSGFKIVEKNVECHSDNQKVFRRSTEWDINSLENV